MPAMVACPRCRAAAGRPCRHAHRWLGRAHTCPPHPERVAAATARARLYDHPDHSSWLEATR